MRNPQTPKGRETREHILETARSLFHRQGFGNTTIKNIIDEAHVAKGTLYLYFQDKYDLMHQMTDEFAAHFQQVVQSAIQSFSTSDQSADILLAEVIDHLVDMCLTYRCCFEFFHKDDAAQQLVDAHHLQQFDTLNTQGMKRIILLGVQRGDFRAIPVDIYADILYQLIHGFVERLIMTNAPSTYIQQGKKELAVCIYRILTKDDFITASHPSN